MVKNLPTNAKDVDSIPESGRSEKEMQPTPLFLPGKFHGQRSLVSYIVHGVGQSKRVGHDLVTKQKHNCYMVNLLYLCFIYFPLFSSQMSCF